MGNFIDFSLNETYGKGRVTAKNASTVLDNVTKLKIIHGGFDNVIHNALAIHVENHICEKDPCFIFLNIHTW